MGDNNFIREQIKEKPVNKRKVLEKVGVSALCGLAFAVIASFGFAVLEPRFSMLLSKDTSIQETETEVTEEETETELETEVETEPVDYELTIEDYQRIQTELYGIGNKANKSIVTVTGVSSNVDWFNNAYENSNNGSGVIISTEGSQILILTERKNISAAEKILVSFLDDFACEASLLGYDATTGLAMLSVVKETLPGTTMNNVQAATFGNSSLVSNGEMVIALGSPLGTNYSILVGNITSKINMISTTDSNYHIFTTDIVASKSGTGVLINTRGQIIGIVMQDYSNSQDEGVLTAVSSDNLSNIIDLLSQGRSVPYLGVEMTTVSDKIATNYDIPKGVFVKQVELDSPALISGIQPGDVIVGFNDSEVFTADKLTGLLLSTNVGDTVDIKVKRQNGDSYRELVLQVIIGKK